MNDSANVYECGPFRYFLTRRWECYLPTLCIVMLHPITDDAQTDDKVITKCTALAHQLGFGEVVIVNLFAYKAKSLEDLRAAGYPIGDENDYYIEYAVREVSDAVICAWGSHAQDTPRANEVLQKIRSWNRKPLAFSLLSDGTPAHPVEAPCADTWIEIDTGRRNRVRPIRDAHEH